MPIDFPFLAEHDLGFTPGPPQGNHGNVVKSDPLPWMRHEAVLGLKDDIPPAPPTGGLAAMAVMQSTSGPLAPPARRTPSCLSSGPAIAASLALAAPMPAQPHREIERPAATAPATNHYQAMQNLQNRDLAQLRMELEAEIEQVRQDLFGAAMGVSALKDRLDDLESTVTKAPPAPPTPFPTEEVARQTQAWLDAHLAAHVEAAVQRTLEQALQQTISNLGSCEFFRMPVRAAGLSPDIILSQAPQILSTSHS